MPRQPRIGLPNHVYHVTGRGNNRDKVFLEEEDFRKYLEILTRYKSKEGFRIYQWVLMNNHVHLLLAIPEEGSLSKAMHGINLAYTFWFNRKYKRVGHLGTVKGSVLLAPLPPSLFDKTASRSNISLARPEFIVPYDASPVLFAWQQAEYRTFTLLS